jgi:hypothetical protein
LQCRTNCARVVNDNLSPPPNSLRVGVDAFLPGLIGVGVALVVVVVVARGLTDVAFVLAMALMSTPRTVAERDIGDVASDNVALLVVLLPALPPPAAAAALAAAIAARC